MEGAKSVAATPRIDESAIQRRDRALIAFTLLTGARDSAIASMKLKHVNLAARYVEQDAREVQNLGHDKVLTTFLSYGQVESPRQGEIIRELAKAVVREMRETGVGILNR